MVDWNCQGEQMNKVVDLWGLDVQQTKGDKTINGGTYQEKSCSDKLRGSPRWTSPHVPQHRLAVPSHLPLELQDTVEQSLRCWWAAWDVNVDGDNSYDIWVSGAGFSDIE